MKTLRKLPGAILLCLSSITCWALPQNYTDFSGTWVPVEFCVDIDTGNHTTPPLVIAHDEFSFLYSNPMFFGEGKRWVPIALFDPTRKAMEPTGDEQLLERVHMFWNEDKTELHQEVLIAITGTKEDAPSDGFKQPPTISYAAYVSNRTFKREDNYLVVQTTNTLLSGKPEDLYDEDMQALFTPHTCTYQHTEEGVS